MESFRVNCPSTTNSSTMYFLIYSSMASPEIEESDLKDIIVSAEKNNNQDEITGMLIFHDGTFFQMLEGSKEKVHAAFEKIQDDPRHSAIIKLFEGETSKRHFPDWKMALKVVHPEEFEQIKAYETIEEGNRFLSEIDDDHIGLNMLRFFYDKHQVA